jgi:AcrR family transcriptional regulator
MFKSAKSSAYNAEARRQRLLKAAAIVFAREGFEKGSLRIICSKAKANVASVKYYFGSKEGLYREVLFECHRELLNHESRVTLEHGVSPEETLRRWLHFCLTFVLLKKPSNPLMGQIMAHEMRQPTACLNDFVKMVVRPFHEDLRRIVAAVLGRKEVDEECMILAHHIVGLCMHYDHGRAVIDRLGPPVPKTEAEIQHHARSIADFVLAGLAASRTRFSKPSP